MDSRMFTESVLFRTILTISILISVFYLSFFIGRWTRKLRTVTRSILMGLYFGVAGVLLLWFNFLLQSTDLIDVRLVMTGIIATWFGIIPAAITLVMMVAGALIAYGTTFAAGVFVLSLSSCAVTGYLLNLVGSSQKHSQVAKRLLNLLFGAILSVQAVLWKYLMLNMSGMKISLLDSGLHKAGLFLLFSYSVGMILLSEREIENKTNALEKANEALTLSNRELTHQKVKIQAAYEQLAASEEELRAQNQALGAAYEQIASSEEEYEALLNAGNEAIWRINSKSGLNKYSDQVFEMFGYPTQDAEAFRREILQRRHPEDVAMVDAYEENLLSGKINSFTIEFRVRKRDGQYIWIRNKATRLVYKNGKDMGIIGSVLDISDVKAYEKKILDMAYTDSLTGLPNRSAFIEHFERLLISADDWLGQGVLFFVDTDNFKYINDVMGHHVGDAILREAGSKLGTLAQQEACYVSRVGGDEFVIVQNGRREKEEIESLAAKIAQVFANAESMRGRKLQMTISIGITQFPQDGRTIKALMKNADISMRKAKGKGKDGWCFFESSLEQEASERMLMESNLRKAIFEEEMVLCYQPQVNIQENLIIGFEALVRWHSPVFGLVSPVRFIPVAEDTGLIIPLGAWILREACLFSLELNRHRSGENIYVSVNISPLQIIHPDFLSVVNAAILETGITPDMLGIEITETALLESFETVADKVEALREKGIHVSLDDFGMGYSSLNHLRTLPIDTVKIDKSFIDDMIRDEKSHILTEEIIRLSHKLGVDIVAEGVEQANQVALLREYHCDAVQGYYFSKPISREDALRFQIQSQYID